jgi:hypothetical protein
MKTESAVASGVEPRVNLACVAGMVARRVEYLWPRTGVGQPATWPPATWASGLKTGRFVR